MNLFNTEGNLVAVRHNPSFLSPGCTNRLRERIFFFLRIVVYGLVTGLSAEAAEYYIDPSLGFEQEYSDNFRLESEDKQQMWISRIQPALDFGYRVENLDVTGGIAANILRYLGDPDLDTVEQFYNLGMKYNTERMLWVLDGVYAIEQSLRSDLAATGAGGLVIVDSNRWGLSPSWRYALSQRQNLQLGYNYSNVTYEGDPVETNLFNYDSHTGQVGFTHRFSERNQVQSSVLLTRFNSDQNDTQTEAIEIQLGGLHRFTETLEASLTVGYIWTFSDFTQFSVGPDSTLIEERTSQADSGFTVNAGLTQTTPWGAIGAELIRRVAPSGRGLLERREAKLFFSHDISKRWNFSLNSSIMENKSLVDTAFSIADRVYFRVAPVVTWRWTEELSLGLAYEYEWAKSTGQSSAAGNHVLFRLSYSPDKFFTWQGRTY